MITRLVVMGGGSREVLLLKLLDMTRSTHFGIFGLVTVASGVSRLPQGYTYSYSSWMCVRVFRRRRFVDLITEDRNLHSCRIRPQNWFTEEYDTVAILLRKIITLRLTSLISLAYVVGKPVRRKRCACGTHFLGKFCPTGQLFLG